MLWYNYVLILYGILCLYIGLLKPPFIWNTAKFKVMKKMFKGDLGVQLLVLVFGITALVLGILL